MNVKEDEARQQLPQLLDRVGGTQQRVVITRRRKHDVALIDAAELSALETIVRLLTPPANALALFEAMEQAGRGEAMIASSEDIERLTGAATHGDVAEVTAVLDDWRRRLPTQTANTGGTASTLAQMRSKAPSVLVAADRPEQSGAQPATIGEAALAAQR